MAEGKDTKPKTGRAPFKKEPDICAMTPPTSNEQHEYFSDVVGSYETKNTDLTRHLKELEGRLEVMEKTAPALMVFNLFKEIESETDLDFGEYVSQMVAQAELGIEPDVLNIPKTDKTIRKHESTDSVTVAQLRQLEALLNEEAAVKNRIAQMAALEADTKAAMEIIGTPEMAAAFEMQNKFDTGKFGKVNVPLNNGSPDLIDMADKLCCTIKTIENCCACKLVKVHGLKSTVEYLSQVLRYAAKHEEDRDKPPIPEAKMAIFDAICSSPGTKSISTSFYSNQNKHPSNHHSQNSPLTSNIVDIESQKSHEHNKNEETHYNVETKMNSPFIQLNNMRTEQSRIDPNSINSLFVNNLVPSNVSTLRLKKSLVNNNTKKSESKGKVEGITNLPFTNQPESYLMTSYNNYALDADYILYKRDDFSNLIDYRPEFIRNPIAQYTAMHTRDAYPRFIDSHYTPYSPSTRTQATENNSIQLQSKYNVFNTQDTQIYTVTVPKNPSISIDPSGSKKSSVTDQESKFISSKSLEEQEITSIATKTSSSTSKQTFKDTYDLQKSSKSLTSQKTTSHSGKLSVTKTIPDKQSNNTVIETVEENLEHNNNHASEIITDTKSSKQNNVKQPSTIETNLENSQTVTSDSLIVNKKNNENSHIDSTLTENQKDDSDQQSDTGRAIETVETLSDYYSVENTIQYLPKLSSPFIPTSPSRKSYILEQNSVNTQMSYIANLPEANKEFKQIDDSKINTFEQISSRIKKLINLKPNDRIFSDTTSLMPGEDTNPVLPEITINYYMTNKETITGAKYSINNDNTSIASNSTEFKIYTETVKPSELGRILPKSNNNLGEIIIKYNIPSIPKYITSVNQSEQVTHSSPTVNSDERINLISPEILETDQSHSVPKYTALINQSEQVKPLSPTINSNERTNLISPEVLETDQSHSVPKYTALINESEQVKQLSPTINSNERTNLVSPEILETVQSHLLPKYTATSEQVKQLSPTVNSNKGINLKYPKILETIQQHSVPKYTASINQSEQVKQLSPTVNSNERINLMGPKTLDTEQSQSVSKQMTLINQSEQVKQLPPTIISNQNNSLIYSDILQNEQSRCQKLNPNASNSCIICLEDNDRSPVPNQKIDNLLWFDQFSKIEMNKNLPTDKNLDHDNYKCHKTIIRADQNQCGSIIRPELNQHTILDCNKSVMDQNSAKKKDSCSWFEKYSSYELAHHSFTSNDEILCHSLNNPKTDTNNVVTNTPCHNHHNSLKTRECEQRHTLTNDCCDDHQTQPPFNNGKNTFLECKKQSANCLELNKLNSSKSLSTFSSILQQTSAENKPWKSLINRNKQSVIDQKPIFSTEIPGNSYNCLKSIISYQKQPPSNAINQNTFEFHETFIQPLNSPSFQNKSLLRKASDTTIKKPALSNLNTTICSPESLSTPPKPNTEPTVSCDKQLGSIPCIKIPYSQIVDKEKYTEKLPLSSHHIDRNFNDSFISEMIRIHSDARKDSYEQYDSIDTFFEKNVKRIMAQFNICKCDNNETNELSNKVIDVIKNTIESSIKSFQSQKVYNVISTTNQPFAKENTLNGVLNIMSDCVIGNLLNLVDEKTDSKVIRNKESSCCCVMELDNKPPMLEENGSYNINYSTIKNYMVTSLVNELERIDTILTSNQNIDQINDKEDLKTSVTEMKLESEQVKKNISFDNSFTQFNKNLIRAIRNKFNNISTYLLNRCESGCQFDIISNSNEDFDKQCECEQQIGTVFISSEFNCKSKIDNQMETTSTDQLDNILNNINQVNCLNENRIKSGGEDFSKEKQIKSNIPENICMREEDNSVKNNIMQDESNIGIRPQCLEINNQNEKESKSPTNSKTILNHNNNEPELNINNNRLTNMDKTSNLSKSITSKTTTTSKIDSIEESHKGSGQNRTPSNTSKSNSIRSSPTTSQSRKKSSISLIPSTPCNSASSYKEQLSPTLTGSKHSKHSRPPSPNSLLKAVNKTYAQALDSKQSCKCRSSHSTKMTSISSSFKKLTDHSCSPIKIISPVGNSHPITNSECRINKTCKAKSSSLRGVSRHSDLSAKILVEAKPRNNKKSCSCVESFTSNVKQETNVCTALLNPQLINRNVLNKTLNTESINKNVCKEIIDTPSTNKTVCDEILNTQSNKNVYKKILNTQSIKRNICREILNTQSIIKNVCNDVLKDPSDETIENKTGIIDSDSSCSCKAAQIRGSYRKQIIELIDYYQSLLLKNIDEDNENIKVVKRSEASLCSSCAKIKEQISLCSCASSCSRPEK